MLTGKENTTRGGIVGNRSSAWQDLAQPVLDHLAHVESAVGPLGHLQGGGGRVLVVGVVAGSEEVDGVRDGGGEYVAVPVRREVVQGVARVDAVHLDQVPARLRLVDVDGAQQRAGHVDQPVAAPGQAIRELEAPSDSAAARALAEGDVAGADERRQSVSLRFFARLAPFDEFHSHSLYSPI
jgi:hypothetical protein